MSVYRIDRPEEAVREVQRYLRAVSYLLEGVPHIGIDGIYGEETAKALRAFQVLRALPPTGVADGETFALLYRDFLRVPRRGER